MFSREELEAHAALDPVVEGGRDRVAEYALRLLDRAEAAESHAISLYTAACPGWAYTGCEEATLDAVRRKREEYESALAHERAQRDLDVGVVRITREYLETGKRYAAMDVGTIDIMRHRMNEHATDRGAE